MLSPWDARLVPLTRAENSSECAAMHPSNVLSESDTLPQNNVVGTLTFVEFDLANDTVEIVDNQITDVVNSQSINQAVAYQSILL